MLTANGAPVLGMQLALPLSGLWVATLEVDSEEDITGELAFEQEGSALSFAGTVLTSGVVAGVCKLTAVAGSGGLVNDIVASHYRSTTARTVFEEILAAAGETYEVSSTRSVMTTSLPYWTRAAGRGSLALRTLADALGARWRVLPSGNVWMGLDSWAAAPEIELNELDRDGSAQTVLIAPDTIELLPGMSLPNGDRVGRIVYTITRDDPLRATYSLEAA